MQSARQDEPERSKGVSGPTLAPGGRKMTDLGPKLAPGRPGPAGTILKRSKGIPYININKYNSIIKNFNKILIKILIIKN